MPKLNISFPSTTSSVGAADAGELTRLNSSGKLDSSFGGSAGSLATLDSGGKVPVGQIPDSVTSGMHYKGAFDASDGVYPSSPTTGDTYRVSVAGNVSGTDYAVGDIAIYNGSAWDHFQMEDHAVLSVNGQTGTVSLSAGDVGAVPQGGPLSQDLDADGYRITGLASPSSGNDAAPKSYVDGRVGVEVFRGNNLTSDPGLNWGDVASFNCGSANISVAIPAATGSGKAIRLKCLLGGAHSLTATYHSGDADEDTGGSSAETNVPNSVIVIRDVASGKVSLGL